MRKPQPFWLAGGSALSKRCVSQMINETNRYTLCAGYAHAEELLADTSDMPPDALILLLCAEGHTTDADADQLLAALPQARILVMGDTTDLDIISRICRKAGGYLHFDECDALIASLHQLSREGWLSNHWARKSLKYCPQPVIPPPDPAKVRLLKNLKPRQLAVVRAIIKRNAAPYQEIADELNMSLNTLKTHYREIRKQLQIGTYPELAVFLTRVGEV